MRIITKFLLVETLFAGNYSTQSESIYTTGLTRHILAIEGNYNTSVDMLVGIAEIRCEARL